MFIYIYKLAAYSLLHVAFNFWCHFTFQEVTSLITYPVDGQAVIAEG